MKRWIEVVSAVAAVLATCGVLIGGVRWAVDPLREDMQTLREEFRADIAGFGRTWPTFGNDWYASRRR